MPSSSAGDCGPHSGSDALLVKAEPEGPVWHTGTRTCFFTPLWEAEARS